MLEIFFLPAYIGPGAGMTFIGSFLILFVAFGLMLLSLLTWPFRFALQVFRRWRLGVKPLVKRVVVVGLDGLDPKRVRRLLEAGKLPNLQKLQQQGTFSELGSTLPPISPVAWSTFMTGVNPGKHNIFDFLNRDLRTYLPELSSAKVTDAKINPFLAMLGLGGSPVRMLRKSQPFWKLLGDHGVFSTILRVPITFPPERFHGLSLSAMCTPDLRGTQGTFTFYATNFTQQRETTGGLQIPVTRVGNKIETRLPGPPNLPGKLPLDLEVSLTLEIDSAKQRVKLKAGTETVQLEVGKYSPWVRLSFKAGAFSKVHGICRFRIESLEPHFRMYVTPVNIDPERPALPIAHPLYYSIYLAKLHDSFATLGLAEDTWALNSDSIDEEVFLEQAYSIHDERERMFFDALKRTRRGLCACVFDASDRIQHMFHRHDLPDHPANAGRDVATHAHAIDDMYVKMDNLVGRVLDEIDDNTFLVVLSDHGFCDFSRGVNLNSWLKDNGFLTLDEKSAPGDYLAGIDWSKTKAYAFGLSGIYINQQGRESKGIVPAAEVAAVKAAISEKLSQLQDVSRKQPAISRVYDTAREYSGPYANSGPDLIVGYHRGYRASWETAVGRSDGDVITDNPKPWSGDHCVDPTLVPGVLFTNKKLLAENPSIVDLAPTILKLFGVPVPTYMDGRSLSFELNGKSKSSDDSKMKN